MAQPQYLVGIDLGTTHTVVASAKLGRSRQPLIELFPIEQLVAPGAIAARPLLPSVRYQGSSDELAEADVALPWPGDEDESQRVVIGELARSLGVKTRGRLIASAKSWLCHPNVDRTAAILPWGAPEGVARISPVDASASYLRHVRQAWNQQHPAAPLEAQDVVITVPASFDEAARALTLDAARHAGLEHVRLLEEPQAVCYDWLYRHREQLRTDLGDVRLILVCDVGGGTTDFTLIRVSRDTGEPELDRIAVGDHLLLGGDNIDLALAHRIEQQIGGERHLSNAELAQLLEQCRTAKERLLADDAPESLNVTLLGAGARLIGAARTAELGRDAVRSLVMDGFFPLVPLEPLNDRRRGGVVEFGLPYAAVPEISRQLAAFLHQHRQAIGAVLNDAEPAVPDAVLLNGGIFLSRLTAERVDVLLQSWRGTAARRLDNDHPELAVAFGAVAYGLARRGRGIARISGGSARSYFLQIDTADGAQRQGVCLLPKGTLEGTTVVLENRLFELRLGTPIRFHLACSSDDATFVPGQVADLDDESFLQLPPLATTLDATGHGGNDTRQVRLTATLTEIGALDLRCRATDDSADEWRIELQLRASTAPPPSLKKHHLDARLTSAAELIHNVFSKKTRATDLKPLKNLRGELERLLGGRDDWDVALARALFDVLWASSGHRRRTAEHERLWFSLAGYCLRPGCGFPGDEWRVDQIHAVYPQALQFVNDAQNWAEWWIFWRRAAAGLSRDRQQQLFDAIAEFINPVTAKRGNTANLAKKRSYENMLRLAGSLERLPLSSKLELGEWLMAHLAKNPENVETAWALGRVGSRVLTHGPLESVVPASRAEDWLDRLRQRDFKNEPSTAFAAALIGRRSNQRDLDIAESLRLEIAERLRSAKAPETWRSLLLEHTALTTTDERRIFGEALPPGLKLIG